MPADSKRDTAIIGDVLRYVSVSQITAFDPESPGGCNRRWFYEKKMGFDGGFTGSQRTGVEVHEQIEHYLKTGEMTLGMVAMSGKRFIPTPDPAYLIEHNFGTSEDVLGYDLWRDQGYPPTWNGTFNGRKTLSAHNIPFIGYIDLVNPTGVYLDDEGDRVKDLAHTIEVVDWKTTSSIEKWSKQARDLPDTVQMAGYAEWAARAYPDAEHFRLSHGNFQTKGGRLAEKRTITIPLATVKEKWQRVSALVAEMKEVAKEADPMKVTPNYGSCAAYNGCPHRSRCPMSSTQVISNVFGSSSGGNMASLLSKLVKPAPVAPATTVAAPTSQPVAPVTGPEVDAEVARLKALEACPVAYGECSACGVAYTDSNMSRLPDGRIVHIGCVKNKVTPPDAPASTEGGKALPVPSDKLGELSPALREAAEKQSQEAAKEAEGKPQRKRRTKAEMAADAAREEAAKEADPSRAAGVIAGVNTKDAATLTGEVEVADALARDEVPGALHFLPPGQSMVDDTPPPMRILFLDCYVQGIDTVSGDRYLAGILGRICDHFRVSDVRAAGSDNPLGYGKWKGILAAMIASEPPDPGNLVLNYIGESEIRQIAAEALSKLSTVIVRGIQ